MKSGKLVRGHAGTNAQEREQEVLVRRRHHDMIARAQPKFLNEAPQL
jgi:hypothetical protein